MVARGRNVEKSEATRRALLEAARELFADKGFAATGTEELVLRAKVTRGALYHHFESKEDLFRALYENIEAELAEHVVRAAARGTDALDRFRRGLDAYLDACLEPTVQRVCLLEAMSVLGWSTWREIESRFALGLLTTGLEAAMTEGAIERRPAEPLAHLLLGALAQASLAVAKSPRPREARMAFGFELHKMLDAMQTDPTRGRAAQSD